MNEETRKKIEEKDAEIADLEKDFDEANERVSSWQDKCQGLQSELSSLKSLLREAIEKEIERLTKKIDGRPAQQALGYIAQREQSKWFLQLLDTVTPE